MNISKSDVAEFMAGLLGLTPILETNESTEHKINTVINALRPNIRLFTIKKENSVDATLRLCSKFLKPVKLKEAKEWPSVAELTNTPGKVDIDRVSILSVRLNTAITAFGLDATNVEKFPKLHKYAQLLSSSQDRAKQVAGILNIVYCVGRLPTYQAEIKSNRPDLDKVNCALMLCYIVYTLSENALLTLLAARLLHLDKYMDRIFDFERTLNLDDGQAKLDVQWIKCDDFLGWRLEDSLAHAVETVFATKMPIAPGKTTLENMKATSDNLQSLFCLTVIEDNPFIEMMAESIQDIDGLMARVKEMQYANAAESIQEFISEKLAMLSKSSLQPKVKPIFSKLATMVSDALDANKACDLKPFKAELSQAMDTLAPKSLLVENQMIAAQKELNFSEMAEHALELEEIKTSLLAKLEHIQQMELNLQKPLISEASESEAARPLYVLYEEEIETLKCKLIDAELRESELKSKVDQLFSQNQSNSNEQEAFDRCFNSATLRFLTGDGKVADVIEVMHSMRPDIVFCHGVREELECSIYGKPEKLLKGLIQLAGYHTATVSGQPDAKAMDILGNNYSANESESVMSNGVLSAMRKFKLPNGEIVEMQQHLTIGTRNGEAYTIQVHFRIIEGVLYIGRIGGHLPNSGKY